MNNPSYRPRPRLSHQVPISVNDPNPIFFITICLRYRSKDALIQPVVAGPLLETTRRYDELGKWRCLLFLVMPDHVHGLVTAPYGLSRVISSWKSWTAKEVGVEWQRNYFDHRLRSPREVGEKAEYIGKNPERAELIDEGGTWPYVFRSEDLGLFVISK